MESRDNPRYPFTAEAEVIELQSGTRITGRMSDLGREGCYVDKINPFPVGTIVKLRLRQAKVIYAQVGMWMGLFFTAQGALGGHEISRHIVRNHCLVTPVHLPKPTLSTPNK